MNKKSVEQFLQTEKGAAAATDVAFAYMHAVEDPIAWLLEGSTREYHEKGLQAAINRFFEESPGDNPEVYQMMKRVLNTFFNSRVEDYHQAAKRLAREGPACPTCFTWRYITWSSEQGLVVRCEHCNVEVSVHAPSWGEFGSS